MTNILEEDTDLLDLTVPEVAYKTFNFHLNTANDLKDAVHYETLSWYKILKEYYKANYGETLKLHREDIKTLSDAYAKISSKDDGINSYSSNEILEYIFILTDLKERLANDKALGHKFAYGNTSLYMEVLYWGFDLFKKLYSSLNFDHSDNKLNYSLLKECNSVLNFLSDNYDVMFKKKLHNLPKVYSLATIKFLRQLVLAMQQELFVKITISNSKPSKLNYSLLSKMAYQVYLYYDDNELVQLFLANRFNNFYNVVSEENSTEGKEDFFMELGNLVNIKKSVWLSIAVYYHCLNLYNKLGKYGEPITILKCFLNNYTFNEHHKDILHLKNKLIHLLNVITKDNDFIYHEEVDTSIGDYKSVVEKKIHPLNSNKFVKFEDNLAELANNSVLVSKINKMFQYIVNLKTLELESLFTAEKEAFLKDQVESILTENMELVTLVEYNQLESLYNVDDADSGDLDLFAMHQTVSSSAYKDVPAIKKQVDYLRKKAVEMTVNAQTENQLALQQSLKNAIENDNKLFENVNLYKNEINLLKNYENLKTVYDSLKEKEGVQELNLIDYEDHSHQIKSQLKEKHEILKDIQYQRNLLMKKFKPNSSTSEEALTEHNDILKLISANKDQDLLIQKFKQYIKEKYAFETSTLNVFSNQQSEVTKEIDLLIAKLQKETQTNDTKATGSSQEFTQFKQKLSNALLVFKTYEQNCKECISYYNSLFELIPQHF